MENPAGRSWGADVMVSLPVVPSAENEAFIDMGGFGWGPNGLVHMMSTAIREEIISNFFHPESQGT